MFSKASIGENLLICHAMNFQQIAIPNSIQSNNRLHLAKLIPMKKYLALTLLVAIAYCSYAQKQLSKYNASSERLKKHVYFLASDSLKGRNTGSNGQKVAAAYIANQLKEDGLTPLSKDAINPFYQGFSLYQIPSNSHFQVNATIKGTTKKVYMLTDIIVLTGDGFGDTEITPYKGSMDAANSPIGYTPVITAQSADEGIAKIVEACKGNVKGSFFLSLPPSKLLELRGNRLTLSSMLSRSVNQAGDTVFTTIFGKSFLAKENEYYSKILPLLAKHPKLNIILTDEGFLKRLFKDAAGADAGNGIQVGNTLEVKGRISADKLTKIGTENVVGILEGTSKRNEAVILCAHYDHIGISRNSKASSKADSICNGADDNASGTAAILEVARLLAQAKKEGHAPSRTIVVAAFTAEELGLVGSKYLVDNPIIPLSNVKALVNLDMVGRTNQEHTDTDMYVYPLVLGDPAGSLAPALSQSAKLAKVDISSPISSSERNKWTNGSDHHNFVEKGIPSVALTTGEHPDYHTPADEANKINYPRLTRIANFAFYTIWTLANK
jgi:hypothetical protein